MGIIILFVMTKFLCVKINNTAHRWFLINFCLEGNEK